jgi:hypothetical protein
MPGAWDALTIGLRQTGLPGVPGNTINGGQMTDTTERVSQLLHEAGETHHGVFRITDGADEDWATWYSNWLVNLSELPVLLGTRPVRSELTYLLVGLDKDYTASPPGTPWEAYYARRIVEHFTPARG